LEFYGWRLVVADAVVVWLFDAVGVVPASFDDSRVGAVSAFRVEVSWFGDVVDHQLV